MNESQTTDPTRRVGKVTVEPKTGQPGIRVTVAVGDLLYEVVEAIADLADQPGDPLRAALNEVSRCRAEEITAAGNPAEERHWGALKREAIDELLSLADVAPDPTVVLGQSETMAIATARLRDVLTRRPGTPLPVESWDAATAPLVPQTEATSERAA